MLKKTAAVAIDTTQRICNAVLCGALMGMSGTTMGITFGVMMPTRAQGQRRKLTEEEKRKQHKAMLLSRLQRIEMIRKAIEAATPILTSAEYDTRRELEALGYFPCSKCGVPHTQPEDEENCLPVGTYWSEDLQRYIPVGHPDWSAEEYEKITGQKWREEDDGDGGVDPVH